MIFHFLDRIEKNLSVVLTEQTFVSSPTKKEVVQFQLLLPLENKDHPEEKDESIVQGRLPQEIPERGDIMPKRINKTVPGVERPFKADEQYENKRPQPCGQGGISEMNAAGEWGDKSWIPDSGMSLQSPMMDRQGPLRANCSTLDNLGERLNNFERKFVHEQEQLHRIEKLFSTKAENTDNCSSGEVSCQIADNFIKGTKWTTLAMIDTGEDASVVSNEVAAKTSMVSAKSRSGRFLNATNNLEMKAFGNVTATIQMANRQYDYKVFTAPVQDPILLGCDFMKAIDVTFHSDDVIGGTFGNKNKLLNACSILEADNGIIPAASEEMVLKRIVNPFLSNHIVMNASDCLKLYSSDGFQVWSNRIWKKITDTNLATLDEDDVMLPSAMDDLTATRNTSEAEEDTPLVTSTGPTAD